MGDRCFCIFEGGGAKGIAHVGALSALEDSGLALCGFAGTSAGAVIAALAAVGYKSDELLGPDGTVLDQIDLDPSNVWGGDPVRPARSSAKLFGPVGWTLIRAARAGGFAILGLAVLVLLLLPVLLAALNVIDAWSAVSLGVACLLGVFLIAHGISSGLASLSSFERGLNQLLRLRLARRIDPAHAHQGRSNKPVTFEDLKNAGCPPLRVVAADISKRELRLFSSETSPEVGVASAVAASVCLPVIFKPWRIGSHLHLDGGLVSNLPAWAFDAERALDRDAWTAVVQVGDAPEAERLFGWRIIKAGILTGIFGSGLLNMRNVDRLKAIRLDVDLKLLQFDPGLDLARQVAEAARSRCVQELVYQLRDVPELMTDICERVRLRVERTFNRALSLEEKSPFTGKLRVSIFVRHREDSSSLAADFQIGFDSAPDERLRVPLLGSIVGQALRENEPLYLDRSDPTWTSYLSRPGERWLRKSVWPDLRWVFCVPYVNLVEGIAMVVAVDSDSYLEVEDDLVDVVLESISDSVVLMLDQFLPKEAFSDGGT